MGGRGTGGYFDTPMINKLNDNEMNPKISSEQMAEIEKAIKESINNFDFYDNEIRFRDNKLAREVFDSVSKVLIEILKRGYYGG